MSSRINLVVFLLIGILVSGNGYARSNAEGVCPQYPNAKLKQIYIFDGKPEKLAYLAPDNPEIDAYILGDIYEKGRTVTIRCEYDTGFIIDVELKNKVDKCLPLEDQAGVTNLICK
jgi:hypothetical protein